MTLTLSQANSFSPEPKDVPAQAAPVPATKSTLATLAKRFWDYTEAAGDVSTKSYDGWL